MSAVPAARYLADFGADGAGHGPGIRPVKDDSATAAAQHRRCFCARSRERTGRGAGTIRCDDGGAADRVCGTDCCRATGMGRRSGRGTGKPAACGREGVRGTRSGDDGAHPEAVSCSGAAPSGGRGAAGQSRRSDDNRPRRQPLTSAVRRDVLDALREQLSGKTTAVTYTPSDDCDVRIVAGQATLETRLKDWMAKLDEATQ